MNRMFTAVVALTLLVLGPAAYGDGPEDEAEPCGIDPPETHPESWGVPDCENAEFLVQGVGATEGARSPLTGSAWCAITDPSAT